MNMVILSMVLTWFLNAQAPLPPSPVMPIPAIEPPGPNPVWPTANGDGPLPLMPVAGQQEVKPPSIRVDAGKPPAFKVIEIQPQPDAPALSPTPIPAADPQFGGGALTPSMLLTRTVPQNVKGGQALNYEIVVRNIGTNAAAQVRLEEELPSGTRFISAQPLPLAQGERLVWIMENLAPGAERRFRVEVEPGRDGDWQATATLNVSVAAAIKVGVAAAGPQLLTMTGPGTLPVGHPVVFTMRVTNTTGAPLTDTKLRVQMAPGLQHLYGDAIEASLGDLGIAQTKEITLDAVTLQPGQLTAEATLLSGKNAVGNARVTVSATEQPTLVIRQTGPLSPPVGGEYEFKLVVVNRGADGVRELQVSDVLPEGLQFSSSDAAAQYDAATRTIRWNVGALPVGQSCQMAFRARVVGTGAQMNRVSAHAAGLAEAQLYSILRLGGGL